MQTISERATFDGEGLISDTISDAIYGISDGRVRTHSQHFRLFAIRIKRLVVLFFSGCVFCFAFVVLESQVDSSENLSLRRSFGLGVRWAMARGEFSGGPLKSGCGIGETRMIGAPSPTPRATRGGYFRARNEPPSAPPAMRKKNIS